MVRNCTLVRGVPDQVRLSLVPGQILLGIALPAARAVLAMGGVGLPTEQAAARVGEWKARLVHISRAERFNCGTWRANGYQRSVFAHDVISSHWCYVCPTRGKWLLCRLA